MSRKKIEFLFIYLLGFQACLKAFRKKLHTISAERKEKKIPLDYITIKFAFYYE